MIPEEVWAHLYDALENGDTASSSPAHSGPPPADGRRDDECNAAVCLQLPPPLPSLHTLSELC